MPSNKSLAQTGRRRTRRLLQQPSPLSNLHQAKQAETAKNNTSWQLPASGSTNSNFQTGYADWILPASLNLSSKYQGRGSS